MRSKVFWALSLFAIFFTSALCMQIAYAASSVDEILNSSPYTTTENRATVHGGCDYDPYQVLESQYRGGGADRCNPKGVQITPQAGMTAGIDPALACRLTKLFKAANDRGCSVKITSAYRSETTQACMCGGGRTGCAAAGRSCHQPGLAVDVSSGCIGWLRMAAPQFHLVFPYYGDHIQCAEHPVAGVSSCNRPCNGGARINPDLSRLPPPSQVPDTYWVPPPNVPVTQSPVNPPQQMCTLPDRTQVPCSAIANRANQPSLTPPPAPTPIAPPQPLRQSQQPNLQQGPLTSDLLNSSYSSTSPTSSASAMDLINAMANPSGQSAPAGETAPLVLTISGSDRESLTQNQNAPPTNASGSEQYSPTAQETFTSSDLKDSPYQETPFQTTMRKILGALKQMLTHVLAYLKPFGGALPQPPEEQYTE